MGDEDVCKLPLRQRTNWQCRLFIENVVSPYCTVGHGTAVYRAACTILNRTGFVLSRRFMMTLLCPLEPVLTVSNTPVLVLSTLPFAPTQKRHRIISRKNQCDQRTTNQALGSLPRAIRPHPRHWSGASDAVGSSGSIRPARAWHGASRGQA